MRWNASQKSSSSFSCSLDLNNMTAKEDLEASETQISTIQVGMQGETPWNGPSPERAHGRVKAEEKVRNWGWLLSGFISMNILLLGIALLSGSVFNKIQISSSHLQIFLILLVMLTTMWMVYYKVHTSRVHHAVLYKDSHAGPIWLRGGLVLFGICSVIMDILKIIYYVGHVHCESPVKIAFPTVQAVFVIVQTYILWVHAKDCVQLQQNITRCGLMLTLSTNLMVWMTAVTEESLHQTVIPNDNSSNSSSNTPHSFNVTLQVRSEYTECQCSHDSCDTFEKAYYYLYPFNIEYSLFASAMAYVMWKNVGRQMDEHHSHNLRFSLWDVLVGPVAGMIILVVGLATFVVYEVDIAMEDTNKRQEALIMHYIMNIVAIFLMSIATLVGCVLFHHDKREQVSGKNPTRSLDVGLLVGASLGQFLICYFTIVAVLASGVNGHVNGLNLACSILTVVQLCLQNAFLITGLHREPFNETAEATVFANVMAVQRDPERRSSSIVPAHTLPIPLTLLQGRLSWKRRILKEICAFLLVCNVVLWIMPAFGARPQFDNTIGFDVYKLQTWSAVVNIGMPFGIFYRMHSVASLFEVCLAS
ncbi:proton channel OTOP2 [Myxocyprinus asiaticus]|uniref:proton channel OTOP2 n=1 Tax=Myxocyprinus asiaticus TaxID=70543 RepID=UPI00222254DD|nr:proton channel OTOP2 [Myxocyprinus asiaticus]XP_051573378.1 proton channel OTOP2 [Myxocyprinus asiaticus]XP_051573379.1 proton channel OTOP2 [Myxocyprinus asiaticus]XP_051573380.1 proton channel OTOP2 [Myxocyprinus asiaticus]